MQPPKLYDTARRDPIGEARALAGFYCDDWKGHQDPGDPGRGLIELNARLIELLAERLNRVPQKNMLAFLDFAGVERAPGSAAEVPVTFVPSPRNVLGQMVPAGTRVATTQSETADAQVFETRSPFFATPVRLTTIVGLAPAADRFVTLAPPALPPQPEDLAKDVAIPILDASGAGATPVTHTFYLASAALFARSDPVDVTLEFTLLQGDLAIFDNRYLSWQRFDAQTKTWTEIPNVRYTSSPPGAVSVVLPAFAGGGKTDVAGDHDAWVACRLKVGAGTMRRLPLLSGIHGKAATPIPRTLPPDAAAVNGTAVELSQPIRPFGERPRYGDAFYIASRKGFAPDVGSVTMRFSLRAYSFDGLKAIFASVPKDTTVTTTIEWQYLAGGGVWNTIASMTHKLKIAKAPPAEPRDITQLGADDHTDATDLEKNGTLFGTIDHGALVTITFSPAADAAIGKIGGIEAYWIRAVIRSQQPYGRDGFVKSVPGAAGAAATLQVVDATFIPPVIERVDIQYDLARAPIELDRVTAVNNFDVVKRVAPLLAAGDLLAPFVSLADYLAEKLGTQPALYLGFDGDFGNTFISMLIALREPRDAAQLLPETGNPRLIWEFLGADSRWQPLDVADGTAVLTASGTVGFLATGTSAAYSLFPQLTGGARRHWYRVRLAEGSYASAPQLQAVLLNSVMADNFETNAGDWVLASGSGEPGQRATILRSPVLEGEIWVRENEVPGQGEIDALLRDLNEFSAIDRSSGIASQADVLDVHPSPTPGGEREVWVRWLRVPNFRMSDARSRHYTLEPASGEVTFGGVDGGLIPPIGKDNIVVRRLRVGGGEAAMRTALPLAVKELKSSLPFVDKVFNFLQAIGGSDPWNLDQIYTLGPQALKNRGRAVSSEDYVWLILSNFSEVARAMCLPTAEPQVDGSLSRKPGAVSVVIVPKGSEHMPQPSRGLLRRIEAFLRANTLGTIADGIHAIAPIYHPVSIRAQVKVLRAQEASLVQRRVVQSLDAFLHPLTGGERRQGWPFGRPVHPSEVFAAIERAEGVDHVIAVDPVDPGNNIASGDLNGDRTLVASGLHQIEVS
jgi:hypothetical protein